MAKAIFEERNFTDRSNGEIRKYDFFGIQGVDSRGVLVELPLKNLEAAEKTAFKMIAAMDDPSKKEVIQKNGGEVKTERVELPSEDDNSGGNWLDSDD